MFVAASGFTRRAHRRTVLTVLSVVLATCFLVSSRAASAQGSAGDQASPLGIVLPAGHGAPHAYGQLVGKKPLHPLAPTRRLASTLPASVNLQSYSVPVGSQGKVGSCVTWAIAYAMMGWYQNYNGLQVHLLNPMSVYSQVHANTSTDPTVGYGGGSFPEDVLNDLAGRPVNGATPGADTMSHYSHHAWDWTDRPNSSEQANARQYEIAGFNSILSSTGPQTRLNIQNALANNRPVAIGFYIRGTSFGTLNAQSYVYSDTTNARHSSHEVLAVGYSSSGLWIQNSWGTGWGNAGYAYLSWSVVEADVNSAYTITGLAQGSDPARVDVTQHIAQQTLTNGAVPVTFSWSDTFATNYTVWLKTDGAWGAPVTQTATQTTQLLLPGHSYQVAVLGSYGLCDVQTNYCSTIPTGYLFSSVVKPGVADDASLAFGTGWTRYGSYTAANKAGTSFTLSFNTNGTDIGLVQATFTNGGYATIACDGAASYTWSFNSANQTNGAVGPWCHWPQAGLHYMTVTVSGTTGSPWVGIDAFAYLT